MPAVLGAAVTASPALANLNGTDWVLVGTTSGKFCALDAQTGATAQGEAFFAGGAIRSSAAVSADGQILFGADDGVLYGLHLDPTSGLLSNFLSTKAGGAIQSSPAIASAGAAGTVVYYSSTDGSLISVGGGP
jgi:outer membrane protein assembly factor BamB